jgi:hypothetical protein
MQWLERLTQKGCIPPENGPNLLGPWQQVGDAGLVGCDIPRRYSTLGAGGRNSHGDLAPCLRQAADLHAGL